MVAGQIVIISFCFAPIAEKSGNVWGDKGCKGSLVCLLYSCANHPCTTDFIIATTSLNDILYVF
jgi:hypothetical protein